MPRPQIDIAAALAPGPAQTDRDVELRLTWLATIATGGDEVQIATAVKPFETRGHRGDRSHDLPGLSVTDEHCSDRAGVGESPTSRKAREVGHSRGFSTPGVYSTH